MKNKLINFNFNKAEYQYNKICSNCDIKSHQVYKVSYKWKCKKCILTEIDNNCTKTEESLLKFEK